MGQAVYHCGDQYFVVNNLVPAVECEIGGDDCRLLVGAEGEMVEEHLCAGLVAGDVTELITDDMSYLSNLFSSDRSVKALRHSRICVSSLGTDVNSTECPALHAAIPRAVAR